MTHQR